MLAICAGEDEIVGALIKAGADLEAKHEKV
jgi:hypothetical protein